MIYIGRADHGHRYLYASLANRRGESRWTRPDMPGLEKAIPPGAIGVIRPLRDTPGYRLGYHGWALYALDRLVRPFTGPGTQLTKLENTSTLYGAVRLARTVYAARLESTLEGQN